MMPVQRLYYDYVDKQVVPYWYVLTFKPCDINWDKPVYVFDAIMPFEFIERDEFDETLISMSIYFSDFIFNKANPGKVGLNLKSIKKRLDKYGVDPYVVRQLIVSLPDIYEVLEYLPKNRKMSFCFNFNSTIRRD